MLDVIPSNVTAEVLRAFQRSVRNRHLFKRIVVARELLDIVTQRPQVVICSSFRAALGNGLIHQRNVFERFRALFFAPFQKTGGARWTAAPSMVLHCR